MSCLDLFNIVQKEKRFEIGHCFEVMNEKEYFYRKKNQEVMYLQFIENY